MKRAALYARYSTENQNDKSIDDQLALCDEYAVKNGYQVVRRFGDAARSGGSMLNRDGLIDLIASAGRKEFDVVIVEALDRLSRDMEDLAGLHKRFKFAGIDLIAVHEGKASTVLVGLRGLVGQLFREDGAEKVRRGMTGVLRSGRSPGGRSYGYRPVLGRPGELSIEPDEAAVILRIFTEYAEGTSPRDIAAGLNRDAVMPPRGTRWNASTINGNATRGHGILLNPIYGGTMLWNRVTMVRDPETGKRVSRPNPESQWQRQDRPDLRIVPPDLFEIATSRKNKSKAKDGLRAPYTPRATRLLSGLLRCGHCGGGMRIDGKQRGRVLIACSAARESGTCSVKRRVFVDAIEQTVIKGMREQLSSPEAMARYIATFNEKRNKEADGQTRERSKIERRIAEIERDIDRIVDAIGSGVLSHEDATRRMPPLRTERAELKQRLEFLEGERKVTTLHPAAIEAYERDMVLLGSALSEAMKESAKARKAFRAIIESVVVTIGERYKPAKVEVRSWLAALIGAPADVSRAVVAGERSGHEAHSYSLRFRLAA